MRLVKVENHLFCLRIVIDTLVVWCLLRGIVVAVATTHIDGHRNLLQVVQRVEELTYNNNRLHAKVHQEGHGRQSENGRQTWNTQQTFYLLADGQTMVATRVETGVAKERCQELSHRH